MLRLVISVFLFLASLLVIFKAPTNLLWRVTVAVTEFPYVPVTICLVFVITCFWADYYKYFSFAFGTAALLIFSAVIVRAYIFDITMDLEKVFPLRSQEHIALAKPFSFGKMFSGIGVKKVEYKRMAYKTLDHNIPLVFDYYPALSEKTAPCVIVIHGGSWASGDSQQLPALNEYLSNRGYNVVSMTYRLAPEYKSPAPVEDLRDLLVFLDRHQRDLRIDMDNLVLLGRSAGGQIALLAAYTFHDPRIKGVISFYAPADMVWGAQVKGYKQVIDSDKVLSDYIGGPYSEVPEKYKASSPFEFVDDMSTPTLIIHGAHDCMVGFQHSVHLHKRLDEHHIKNYFLAIPWATHGCDYNINGPSGQLTTYAVERFINSVVDNR